jgi:phospholipid N-methyltransferase
MSLIRYNKIQLEALKMIEVDNDFYTLLQEYLVDENIPSIDKVDLTDWLESKGIKWN